MKKKYFYLITSIFLLIVCLDVFFSTKKKILLCPEYQLGVSKLYLKYFKQLRYNSSSKVYSVYNPCENVSEILLDFKRFIVFDRVIGFTLRFDNEIMIVDLKQYLIQEGFNIDDNFSLTNPMSIKNQKNTKEFVVTFYNGELMNIELFSLPYIHQ
jgi:hypothetical protein